MLSAVATSADHRGTGGGSLPAWPLRAGAMGGVSRGSDGGGGGKPAAAAAESVVEAGGGYMTEKL